jgi:hypothetical protein
MFLKAGSRHQNCFFIICSLKIDDGETKLFQNYSALWEKPNTCSINSLFADVLAIVPAGFPTTQ